MDNSRFLPDKILGPNSWSFDRSTQKCRPSQEDTPNNQSAQPGIQKDQKSEKTNSPENDRKSLPGSTHDGDTESESDTGIPEGVRVDAVEGGWPVSDVLARVSGCHSFFPFALNYIGILCELGFTKGCRAIRPIIRVWVDWLRVCNKKE